jgi:hypothetical protein
MTVRELELAILRLIQQLDELMSAVPYTAVGKSLNLVDPTMLHSILKNISLHLRDGYELIAGTKTENVHFYYGCTQTACHRRPPSCEINFDYSFENS